MKMNYGVLIFPNDQVIIRDLKTCKHEFKVIELIKQIKTAGWM